MTSEQIYAQGLALMTYDISRDVERYRFRHEDFTLPAGNVPTRVIDGMRVAKIDDVRKAAK